MRIRSVQEVEQEIKVCLEEYRYYCECANLHKGMGYYSWGDPSYIPKMNKCIRHLYNLNLELNRSRIREWERRAERKNIFHERIV